MSSPPEYQPGFRLFDTGRRQRWTRSYIIFSGLAVYSIVVFAYSFLAYPNNYRILMSKSSDPTRLFRTSGVVAIATFILSMYGICLCYRFADQGGELHGGPIGCFGRWFCIWSSCVAGILTLEAAVMAWATFFLTPQKTLLLPAMQLYGSNDDGQIQATFDTLQRSLRCCGSESYDEWFEVLWMPAYNLIVGVEIGFPDSCCDTSGGRTCNWAVTQTERDRLTPFQIGCAKALNDSIVSSLMILNLLLGPLSVIMSWIAINIGRTLASGQRQLEDEIADERHRRLIQAQKQMNDRLRRIKRMRKAAESAQRAAERRLEIARRNAQRRINHANVAAQRRLNRALEEASRAATARDVAEQRLVWEKEEMARKIGFERQIAEQKTAFERHQRVEDMQRQLQLQKEKEEVEKAELKLMEQKTQDVKDMNTVGLDASGKAKLTPRAAYGKKGDFPDPAYLPPHLRLPMPWGPPPGFAFGPPMGLPPPPMGFPMMGPPPFTRKKRHKEQKESSSSSSSSSSR